MGEAVHKLIVALVGQPPAQLRNIVLEPGALPHKFVAPRSQLCVLRAPSIIEMMDDDEQFAGEEVAILVYFASSGENIDAALRPYLRRGVLRAARLVLVTADEQVDSVSELMNDGALDCVCYAGALDAHALWVNVSLQAARYEYLREHPGRSLELDAYGYLFGLELTEAELTQRLVAAIDDCLGYQPRIRVPAGTRLTNEGQVVEEVTICLSGRVALERVSEAGNVIMHHATTGRIIGLLALTQRRKAFFTSRATTDVEAIHLGFEQFDYVLEQRPEISTVVAALFIHTLNRRLRRSEDIQIEKVELTRELELERENLARALSSLEHARAELMSQARFASLGELAAGVAHELNNPMAAVQRTSEHLLQEVRALIGTAKDATWAQVSARALDAAHGAQTISTKDERKLRKQMAEVTGDAALAQRLVLSGVRDVDFARDVVERGSTAGGADAEGAFATVELAAGIGTGLRNLATASTRITELVASLRAYARPDGDPITDVDVNQTLDDTLRLLSHRLRGIDVERSFGRLPRITCIPGQISQVWTNLLTNAAEAMQDAHPQRLGVAGGASPCAAKIVISTKSVRSADGEEKFVRVQITDTGPGIPPEVQQRIFEPRFTTKSGQVRFGMGIGLGVCMSIVQRHKGTIDFVTSSQGTTFTVVLPVLGPSTIGTNLERELEEDHDTGSIDA